jgi:hypothetical protein
MTKLTLVDMLVDLGKSLQSEYVWKQGCYRGPSVFSER